MKTHKCEKCGLKFKAKAKHIEENRSNMLCFATCPRCKAEISWMEEKETKGIG